MIFALILSSSAAVLLYTGLLFLIISIRKGDRGIYLIFALSSLFYGIHIIIEIFTIQQETISGILLFFKPQVAIELVAGILWLWAIADYTQIKPRRLLWFVTSIYALLATLNLALPYGTIWQKISGLQTINLPWGESYIHLMGTPHPLIALGSTTGIVVFIFFFYACFQQYRRGERHQALILAFCLVVVIISTVHIYLVDAGVLPQFISTVPFAFLLMIIVMSLRFADETVKTELQLQYYTTHLEQIVEARTHDLQAAIQEATLLEERNRLASELHDSVNQTLHSLVMIADSLPKLWQTHPDKILPGLRKIQQLAQGGLVETRNLLSELNPQKLVAQPLGELLRQLSQAIAHRNSIKIDTCIGSNSQLPPEVQTCFYRIAQEALNNVVRHAQARQVEVHLNCQHLASNSEQIKMLVKDNGLGFNQQDVLPGNLGLDIMTKRSKKIGASLKITSKPGKGTEVLLEWSFQSIKYQVNNYQAYLL